MRRIGPAHLALLVGMAAAEPILPKSANRLQAFPGSVPANNWRVIIVDTSGIVRLVRKVELIDSVQRVALAWEGGRLAFATHCGHCHGDDGTDTSYPNTKSLGGIVTRMTHEKILEGGQMFGSVDTAIWPPSLKEAVRLYIEGL